jgi:hypothetical protein
MHVFKAIRVNLRGESLHQELLSTAGMPSAFRQVQGVSIEG